MTIARTHQIRPSLTKDGLHKVRKRTSLFALLMTLLVFVATQTGLQTPARACSLPAGVPPQPTIRFTGKAVQRVATNDKFTGPTTFNWTFIIKTWDRSSPGKRRKTGSKITIKVVESTLNPNPTTPLAPGVVANSCYGIQLGVTTEFQQNEGYNVAAVLQGGDFETKNDYIVNRSVGFVTPTKLPTSKPTSTKPPSTTTLAAAAKLSPTDAFELALYRKLVATVGETENFVASPYSITEALAMLRGGARGPTAQRLDAVTSGGVAVDHQKRKQLRELLLNESPNATGTYVHIANSLWTKPGYPLTPEFSELVQNTYRAKVAPANFETDPVGSAKQINDWISEVTEKQITSAVDPIALVPETRAVLVNAVLFHGKWLTKFIKGQTTTSSFGVDAKRVETATMHGRSMARIDAGQTDASLFYTGPYRMRIIMPKTSTKAALDVASAALYSGPWQPNPKADCKDVPTSLPKWTVATSLDLNESLIALGISNLFETRADLTGISPNAALEGLFISKAFQKATITVDEEGTTAAAATVAVAIPASGSPVVANCPKEVTFNQPFVYAIQHYQTGQVLFIGRVMDPTK
jgi:serpin B